jgi:hypothetical protein
LDAACKSYDSKTTDTLVNILNTVGKKEIEFIQDKTELGALRRLEYQEYLDGKVPDSGNPLQEARPHEVAQGADSDAEPSSDLLDHVEQAETAALEAGEEAEQDIVSQGDQDSPENDEADENEYAMDVDSNSHADPDDEDDTDRRRNIDADENDDLPGVFADEDQGPGSDDSSDNGSDDSLSDSSEDSSDDKGSLYDPDDSEHADDLADEDLLSGDDDVINPTAEENDDEDIEDGDQKSELADEDQKHELADEDEYDWRKISCLSEVFKKTGRWSNPKVSHGYDQTDIYYMAIAKLDRADVYSVANLETERWVLERALRLLHRLRYGQVEANLRITPYIDYSALGWEYAAEVQKSIMEERKGQGRSIDPKILDAMVDKKEKRRPVVDEELVQDDEGDER